MQNIFNSYKTTTQRNSDLFLAGAQSNRKFIKAANKTEAARLYWKEHKNHFEIAEELGISRQSVTNYLKEVGEEWKQERLEIMDAVFERDILELEAMEANAKRFLQKFGDAIDGKIVDKDGKVIVDEGKIVDESYLNSKEAVEWTKAMLKIKELKGKRLGFDSPQKVQHSGSVAINLTVADCGEDEDVEIELPEDD